MAPDTIAVPTPDGTMPAHLWRPALGTGPGILLLQEIFGVSDYIERRAQDLADLGYTVLAPEIYWRIGASRIGTVRTPWSRRSPWPSRSTGTPP